MLLRQLSFVDDPEAAMEMMRDQKAEAARRQREAFGGWAEAQQQQKRKTELDDAPAFG